MTRRRPFQRHGRAGFESAYQSNEPGIAPRPSGRHPLRDNGGVRISVAVIGLIVLGAAILREAWGDSQSGHRLNLLP